MSINEPVFAALKEAVPELLVSEVAVNSVNGSVVNSAPDDTIMTSPDDKSATLILPLRITNVSLPPLPTTIFVDAVKLK